jgi:hypothetical protein
MYKRKLSAEEALETIKLRMNYDSSKTLNENVNVIEEQKIDTDIDFIKKELDATFNTDEQSIVDLIKKNYKTRGAFDNLMKKFKEKTGGDFGAYMGKGFNKSTDTSEFSDLEKHLKGLGITLGQEKYKVSGNNTGNKLTFGGGGAPTSGGDGGGGGTTQTTMPSELKSVTEFQDWLDKNKPGWHDKYNTLGKNTAKGYGKFGPRTSKAWSTYKDEYLKVDPKKEDPTKTNPDLEVDDKDAGFDQPF